VSGRLVTLLEETVTSAVSSKHVTRKELVQVIVDTTVQKKSNAHSIDSRLSLKVLEKLAAAEFTPHKRLRDGICIFVFLLVGVWRHGIVQL
jgi:hypothetical protein